MDAEMVTAITAAVVSVGTLIFTQYNKMTQKYRDKMNDMKLERYKQETERLSFKRSENTAKVFGELWKVLYETKADRVYIVQPHPLGNSAFLSIYFEVKRKGVSGMKDNVQRLPMSEMAVFSRGLAENLFLCYTDIDSQVKDKMAKSLFITNGCRAVAIKRLNSASDWVGNIFCEFTDEMEVSEEQAHKVLHDAAVNIQFILPEYRENPYK
ncbi:hypothetical protein [Phocaeicola plebeius]|uniref:hypothetical protein n=1 Tax=Phocaeicola plebeius TaxID=310297 RepID=UPI003AEFE817